MRTGILAEQIAHLRIAVEQRQAEEARRHAHERAKWEESRQRQLQSPYYVEQRARIAQAKRRTLEVAAQEPTTIAAMARGAEIADGTARNIVVWLLRYDLLAECGHARRKARLYAITPAGRKALASPTSLMEN